MLQWPYIYRFHRSLKFFHSPPTFISSFRKFIPTSISNNIWDTSKLLLLSGELESNPGPCPINTNPVFWTIYSLKINWGIQQDTAPTCSDTNCNAQCQQACNGLSTNQARLAKTCGRTITWKCPQHGTGIAEIIIPHSPVYELPSHPSAASKLCSVCKNPIRSRYADLAYHCADPSCDVCHLAATYSGFINPRGPTRGRTLSTQIWDCPLHSSPTAIEYPSFQPDTSPASHPAVIKLTLESRRVSFFFSFFSIQKLNRHVSSWC